MLVRTRPKQLYIPEREPVIGHASTGQPVRLTGDIIEKHWQICGSTGTGKSAFLYQLCLFLLHSNNGGIIIDPHGSLKENLEYYVSEFAPFLADKIIFIDNFTESLNYVVGLSPIRSDIKDDEIQYNTLLLVESILKAFGGIPSETPRISRQLYNTILPLVSSKVSLIEAQHFLDPSKELERAYFLENTQDQMVKADWQLLSKLPPAKQLEQLEGLANRLRPLLSNDRLRMILSAKPLDLARIMEEKKIVILNANPGNKAIAAEARLLGIILINSIYTIAKNRNWRNKHLSNFFVVIDEFAQYVCHEVGYSLEQLRKFRCYFILSHQHYAQLAIDNPYLAASVLGNCHTKLSFSVSYDDAEILAKQMLVPNIDLLEVKYIDQSERYRPTLQLMDVITESWSSTSSESFTNGYGQSFTNSSSNTTGTSESNSTSTSQGDSRSQSSGEQWADGEENPVKRLSNGSSNHVTRSNALMKGFSSSVSNSTGKSEGYSSNNSTTKGSSKGTSRSVSHSPVTIHEKFIEEKPVFFTLQEQIFRYTAKLVNQGVGEAHLKTLGAPATPLKLIYIPPIAFDEIKSPVLLECLQENLVFFHDCYQPVNQVQTTTKTIVLPPQTPEPVRLLKNKEETLPAEQPKKRKKSIFSPTIEEE
jgi:hypothetical protein